MENPESTAVPTVRESVRLIHEGAATSEQLVRACLDVIDATEPGVGAWVSIDREQALDQAKKLDESRRRGRPLGELHGIPVGIKDNFDTAQLPTRRGTPIYVGRQPDADCAVVEKLREAGAVILGKTVCTEFAWMHPSATRNPHNAAHTPGGSSSGSAAAVAAGQVPLAVGSQTNGSVLRPASYCGIYGFKPSAGIISRRGVFETSATLDQVGVFARDAGDAALLADVLGGYDAADPMSYLAPRPKMLPGYLAEVPIEPNFAWIDELPYADRYSEATRLGCEELLDRLGAQVERIPAPQSFAGLLECHKVIYDYEIVRCLASEYADHRDLISATAASALESARSRTREDYDAALATLEGAKAWFRQFFYDYDAIVTPAALGEAPPLSDGTGDPVCSTIWTLCGLPCLAVPLLAGDGNLPIGVQLVAGHNEDDRLFRTTRWLLANLNPDHA